MSQSITALYKDRHAAALAVENLSLKGVPSDAISVLMADSSNSDKEFAVEVNTKAPEGAAAGGAIGGAIGALTGGLAAVGTVTLTGGAGLLAAGPLVAALAGGGAGAAAGGIVGGLAGLGFEEHEAKLVESDIENGSVLVAAEVNDENKDDVESWLKNTGAKKVTVH